MREDQSCASGGILTFRRAECVLRRRLLLRHAEAVNTKLKGRLHAHQVNGRPSDPRRPLFWSLQVDNGRSDPSILMVQLGSLLVPLSQGWRLKVGQLRDPLWRREPLHLQNGGLAGGRCDASNTTCGHATGQ